MSERAQRTRVKIGDAEVEVALFKTSGEMPEARHETRRVDEHGELVEGGKKAPADVPDTVAPSQSTVTAPRAPRRLTKQPAQYRHGVTVNDEFIDMTELLAKIDEANKLDAAEVNATVPNGTLPRLRIRDSYYVAPAEPDATDFLAHLWVGLRGTASAAVLRWSKRTNQALGALVALRNDGSVNGQPILVLLELEWQEAMRPAPAQAFLGDAVAEVTSSSATAVVEAMRELRRKPEIWDEMRDERNAQRAAALDAVRNGQKWTAPEPEKNVTVQLGDAILAAVR
jgi:hypothetical protein